MEVSTLPRSSEWYLAPTTLKNIDTLVRFPPLCLSGLPLAKQDSQSQRKQPKLRHEYHQGAKTLEDIKGKFS